jgi:hypothetical protein
VGFGCLCWRRSFDCLDDLVLSVWHDFKR